MVPTPAITDIDPPFAKPGDQVTITGVNFIADGSRMTVTFQHAIADIVDDPGNGDTQLLVTVPAGAYSGGVLVCVASDNCSDPFPYYVRYEPQGFLASPTLSSIAGEPGTRSLWFADRTPLQGRVYEIVPSGTVFSRGSLSRAILAHPSPGDGTGRVYFCNSNPVASNNGSIYYVDSTTNQQVFFRNAGDAVGGDPVWCRAIAANDLEPDVAYFLDGNNHRVRRVKGTGAPNNNYGGQSFNFADPAGARFDSSGNLYLTSTDSIYRILPEGSGVELVADGFTEAAGIDLLEDGNDTLLAVADKGAGAIFLVNAATGEKSQVASNLSEPVAVAFFLDFGHQAGSALYVPEPAHILRLPDPRIRFERDRDQRIVLSRKWAHKYPSEDAFPSPDQEYDYRISVRVLLNPVMNPTGRSAHFQLEDPKDPSRYNDHAGDRDNEPTSPAGQLVPGHASFDGQGIAKTEIHTTSHYSGNNYQIAARLDGSGGPPRARSPIYTTWRRVYIEHDRMWKAGAWVVGDSGHGQPNPKRVFAAHSGACPTVDPPEDCFIEGEVVHILAGGSLETAMGERGTVAVGGIGTGYIDIEPFDPHPSTGGLRQLYLSAQAPPPEDEPPFSFLARESQGYFDVEPDLDRQAIAFDDAFVNWVTLPSGGYLPHWPLLETNQNDLTTFVGWRSPRFFKAELTPRRPGPSINTVQVVSAARGSSGISELNGAAFPVVEHNWAWVFDKSIAGGYPGEPPQVIQLVRENVTAHELAHLFSVNDWWNSTTNGHCDQDAWTVVNLGTLCLMNPARARHDGIGKFHKPEGTPNNPTHELMCIRSHIDDMNSDSTEPCDIP